MKTISRLFAATIASTVATTAMAKPITAVIRLKEKVAMEELARSVREPISSRYAHPFSPEEIRAIAAPSDQEYASLLTNLKQEGITVVSESKTHLWITVRADSAVFNRVFGTHIQHLSATLHRNVTPAVVPAQLSLVAAVEGLDNMRKMHPLYRHPMDADSAGGISQATIKTAYGFDPIYKSGLTGKGQHIAIATYDGFNIDDIKSFYSQSNLSPGPTVDQVKFNGDPTYDVNSAMETQLDAEFSGMIAPGANIHVFASAENSDAGELAMYTAILDDNRAKIVNYSWGSCETYLTPQHKDEMAKVFARAVAQGVNVMVASGDSGSDSCQDGSKVADWPAANPDVVAVGGTTFNTDGSNNLAEVAWSGSGGGISDVWDLPAYQNSLGAPYTKRSYPDVAFNADPQTGQAIYAHIDDQDVQWIVIGGTSMAAPQWSGFLALVGEARANANKATLGFLNPIIYGLGESRASVFHDVTSGNNGAYNAGPGWDAVTGYGSMKADALLSQLSGL